MQDLFGETYPQSPGYRDTDTSRAAAASMAPKAKNIRDRVLEAIRACPSTADEVAKRIGETPLATRPRTTELKALSMIEDTGSRRPNSSGRNAIVYRAVTR